MWEGPPWRETTVEEIPQRKRRSRMADKCIIDLTRVYTPTASPRMVGMEMRDKGAGRVIKYIYYRKLG